MKFIVLLIMFMIINLAYSQNQSNEYSFITTKKLDIMKADAVKKADYNTAAKIQDELELRKLDEQKIKELKIELAKVLESANYEKADQFQKQIKALENKDILRSKIETAVNQEDYNNAKIYSEELTKLYYTTKPKETPIQNLEPKPIENKENTIVENVKNSRSFLAASIGMNAPLGAMSGSLEEKGLGVFMSIRTNSNAFTSHDHKLIFGEIEDADEDMTYTYSNVGYYSRFEINLGITKKIFGNLSKVSGHFYSSLGIARYKYLYEFNRYGSYGTNFGSKIVFDDLYSGWNLNIENGLILNFNYINIHFGGVLGVPNVRQSMCVTGIGFTLKSKN